MYTIAYQPELNKITNNVNATLLLCKIIKLWKCAGKRAFYKYNAPCQSAAYTPGDSMCEELGFTISQLKTARRKIATRISTGMKKSEYKRVRDDQGNLAPVQHIILYWETNSNQLHYWLNTELLDEYVKSYQLSYSSTAGSDKSVNSYNTANHSNNNTDDDALQNDHESGEFSFAAEGRDQSAQKEADAPALSTAMQAMLNIGVTNRIAKKLELQFSPDRIMAVCNAALSKNNPPGWAYNALHDQYQLDPVETTPDTPEENQFPEDEDLELLPDTGQRFFRSSNHAPQIDCTNSFGIPGKNWQAAYYQLELQLDRASFDIYLRDATMIDYQPESVTFVIAHRHTSAVQYLQNRLYRNIARVLSDICGQPVTLQFVHGVPA